MVNPSIEATTPTIMPGPETTYQSYGVAVGEPLQYTVPTL